MKVLVETSVLVSGSICWEYKIKNGSKFLTHRFFRKCNDLFETFKKVRKQSALIVTKTVENEARNALKNAVVSTIKERDIKSLQGRYKEMILQHLVLNNSLDRLDYYVEECSIRLPIDTTKRNEIRDKEIEPFLKELVKQTIRYIQPRRVPGRVVRDWDLREEVKEIMYNSLPEKGVFYKGMPGERDLTIMAEATLLTREDPDLNIIYVASCDNHFKPNPVQIGSYLSERVKYTGELDSTVRDALFERFLFFCDDPLKIINRLKDVETEEKKANAVSK